MGNAVMRRGIGAWLLLFALLLAPASIPSVLANGGTVRVAGQVAGPYVVTVFTSPGPLRVGEADVSVLVQVPGSDRTVPDARVTVTAEGPGSGAGGTFEATHEQATNKLYYAAAVPLPTAGRWRLAVAVAGPVGEGSVAFEAEVEDPGLLDGFLAIALLVALPLALAGWWLSRRAWVRGALSVGAWSVGRRTGLTCRTSLTGPPPRSTLHARSTHARSMYACLARLLNKEQDRAVRA